METEDPLSWPVQVTAAGRVAMTSARVVDVQRRYYWFIRPAREGSAAEPLR
jgi:hypothetical protein